MRFFFDNNMSPCHALALDALSSPAGSSVVHIKDKFRNRSVADEVWLATLGSEGGWVVVSNDLRIWKTPHLREAWRRSKLTVFFLVDSWGNMSYWDKSVALVRAWPSMLQVAGAMASGSAFEVPKPPRALKQLRA